VTTDYAPPITVPTAGQRPATRFAQLTIDSGGKG
jgi:hypothetical protein